MVDIRTFNKVDLNDSDINNELFYNFILDDYKKNMKKFNLFEEIFLIVDLIFLKNTSNLINEKISKNYYINIYMKEKDTFIMHLKI